MKSFDKYSRHTVLGEVRIPLKQLSFSCQVEMLKDLQPPQKVRLPWPCFQVFLCKSFYKGRKSFTPQKNKKIKIKIKFINQVGKPILSFMSICECESGCVCSCGCVHMCLCVRTSETRCMFWVNTTNSFRNWCYWGHVKHISPFGWNIY